MDALLIVLHFRREVALDDISRGDNVFPHLGYLRFIKVCLERFRLVFNLDVSEEQGDK